MAKKTFTKYPSSYVKASRHWREKTECKTKNGKIVHMQNVSSIFNDRDYYILYDADGKFVEQSLDFNDLHDKLYDIKASASYDIEEPTQSARLSRSNAAKSKSNKELLDQYALLVATGSDDEQAKEILYDEILSRMG